MEAITVTRRNGPNWLFQKEGEHWIYRTRQNTYRLFVDEADGDIWIGRLYEQGWVLAWQIGAVSVRFWRGTFTFN